MVTKKQEYKKDIFTVVLWFTLSVIIACDTSNLLSIDAETLKIKIESEAHTVNIGDTTTINANVNYSGDSSILSYEWQASGGRIAGDGASVVYVVPQTSGTYTIKVKVFDGNVTANDAIQVEVKLGHAIVTMPDSYWQGNTFTQSLTYRVNIEKIFRDDITLQYEILQDTARAGVFLTITINDIPVVRNRAIGDVQPADQLLIADDVDISSNIIGPGTYEFIFTLDVVNVMEDAWLLRKLTLIGVEGTISEVR